MKKLLVILLLALVLALPAQAEYVASVVLSSVNCGAMASAIAKPQTIIASASSVQIIFFMFIASFVSVLLTCGIISLWASQNRHTKKHS